MLREVFQISRVFKGLLKTRILLKTNIWSSSSVRIFALFIIAWIIKWRLKRVCWDIIINEALCSMGKKVCYILLPSAKFGLLLGWAKINLSIPSRENLIKWVIYWPLSDDSIMDSGTWQNKAVVKCFLEDVHWPTDNVVSTSQFLYCL